MSRFSIIIIFILTASTTAFSQKVNWLSAKFKNADTILLVSHEATTGIVIVDSAGNRELLPKLITAGTPNYNIIKEQQIVAGDKLDSLIKILERPFRDRVIETAKCFMPHHAIFIIKNGKTSFIDICFACRGFDSSKDMQKLYAFDQRKWMELENFFLELGFKYELIADE